MTLRPMSMEDADFMLALKNDPTTRQFAILSHEEIKKEDHYRWLEKNLMFFQVIAGPMEKVGAVRVFGKEISIWVDSKFRGLGVATNIIKQVSFDKGYTAKIVDGNVSSLRAFLKAGFMPVAHSAIEKYYFLQK